MAITEAQRPLLGGYLRNARARLVAPASWWPWLVVTLAGVVLAWAGPGQPPNARSDFSLAPLVAFSLLRVLGFWTSRRAAWVGTSLYMLLLVSSYFVLDQDFGGLATRNLTCMGSAQLLVSLGFVELLLHRSLSPSLGSLLLLVASQVHPQFVFGPLLLMILVRPHVILRPGLIEELRSAALWSSLCSLGVLRGPMETSGLLVRWDAVILPLAWWIGSWLMVEEVFMPPLGRLLTLGVFCSCTIPEFWCWPGMGLVLLATGIFEFLCPDKKADTRGATLAQAA